MRRIHNTHRLNLLQLGVLNNAMRAARYGLPIWVMHAEGKRTRMLWKTTTNTVGDVVEEESWNAVNEGSLRAVEATLGWEIFDIRSAANDQHVL